MTAQPGAYPTTSDILQMMHALGYSWSNDAQTYYNRMDFDLVSRKMAERIYENFIGGKPYRNTPKGENDL